MHYGSAMFMEVLGLGFNKCAKINFSLSQSFYSYGINYWGEKREIAPQ